MQGLTHWAAEAALMDRSICMLTLIEPTLTNYDHDKQNGAGQ